MFLFRRFKWLLPLLWLLLLMLPLLVLMAVVQHVAGQFVAVCRPPKMFGSDMCVVHSGSVVRLKSF